MTAGSGAAAARVVVHGIVNCDTVKRARHWLDEHGVGYRFHDFKRHGVPADELGAWIAELGWEALLNRQGTTWRKLDEAARAAVGDAQSASELMQSRPSVIRRPVVRWGDGQVTAGFDAALFARRTGG